MKRYGIISKNTGSPIGFMLANSEAEAKQIFPSAKNIIYPSVKWKEKTIGFSDQREVYEISFQPIQKLNHYALDAGLYFQLDDNTGGRMHSELANSQKIPVYSGNKIIGYLEHYHNLPTVTKFSLGKKEDRHWYKTGWRRKIGDDVWIRVFNVITDKVGYVKVQKGLFTSTTALATNFSNLQSFLLSAETAVQTNVVKPIKTAVQTVTDFANDAKEKVGEAIDFGKIALFAAGLMLLLSKINK